MDSGAFTWDQVEALDGYCGCLMAYFGLLSTDLSVQEIAPGSPLESHQHDLEVGGSVHINPLSLTWRALAAASEQAGFAEHMRYVTTGGIVVRPQTTLARTTMLGAARALYLLRPEQKAERLIRAAELANDEADDAQRLLDRQSAEFSGVLYSELTEQTTTLRSEAAAVLRSAGKNEKRKKKENALLTDVAHELEDASDDDENDVLSFWNHASGVSHARSWVWSMDSGRLHPAETFLHTWSIPCRLLVEAWSLWNRGRGSDAPPAIPPEGWAPDRTRWGPIPSES